MHVVHHVHQLELNIVNCIGNDIKSNSFNINKSQMSRMLRMMCVQPIKLKWISNSLFFLSIYNAYSVVRVPIEQLYLFLNTLYICTLYSGQRIYSPKLRFVSNERILGAFEGLSSWSWLLFANLVY